MRRIVLRKKKEMIFFSFEYYLGNNGYQCQGTDFKSNLMKHRNVFEFCKLQIPYADRILNPKIKIIAFNAI